ncbi:vitamin B12 ABC transporter ATP-binding protein BtuD [Vibrio pelagius]|uniref:Vitamin B12 import ATP-binding protein BtuD n=1 Tax=Vibrio pelagius TaxID=28169 RepID=A0ABY5G3E9_VIBPE|nr:vitamin B12 ABC transporter ATP-binding protein BtuD [Vibrio pelagius]UTT84679.1 vitamin B12 ABC transporter ATP-binding protein BtuD [Vibrio pelagius]
MIQIKSLSVGSRLLPLSFNLKPGQVTHVIGPNGSGKSTLLEAISGIGEGYAGEVMWADRTLSSFSLQDLSLQRAYLSQSARPAFNLEVFQFLALSLPSSVNLNSAIVSEVLVEVSQMLEISDKLHRSIQTLSGGEWQRVRLAGMCLQIWPSLNPYSKLLILDEPAAPLDIGQEALLYKLIDHVAKQGISVLMANHDLNRTLRHADQVLLLDKGVLQNVGSAEKVMVPERLEQAFNTRIKSITVDDATYLLFE